MVKKILKKKMENETQNCDHEKISGKIEREKIGNQERRNLAEKKNMLGKLGKSLGKSNLENF